MNSTLSIIAICTTLALTSCGLPSSVTSLNEAKAAAQQGQTSEGAPIYRTASVTGTVGLPKPIAVAAGDVVDVPAPSLNTYVASRHRLAQKFCEVDGYSKTRPLNVIYSPPTAKVAGTISSIEIEYAFDIACVN